jgi:hypothetical protein
MDDPKTKGPLSLRRERDRDRERERERESTCVPFAANPAMRNAYCGDICGHAV